MVAGPLRDGQGRVCAAGPVPGGLGARVPGGRAGDPRGLVMDDLLCRAPERAGPRARALRFPRCLPCASPRGHHPVGPPGMDGSPGPSEKAWGG